MYWHLKNIKNFYIRIMSLFPFLMMDFVNQDPKTKTSDTKAILSLLYWSSFIPSDHFFPPSTSTPLVLV